MAVTSWVEILMFRNLSFSPLLHSNAFCLLCILLYCIWMCACTSLLPIVDEEGCPLMRNSSLRIKKSFPFKIGGPPQITVFPPHCTHVPEEYSLALPCQASGDPPPAITWKLRNKPLEGSRYSVTNGTLTISPVRPSDQGTFWCFATNEHAVATTMSHVRVLPLTEYCGRRVQQHNSRIHKRVISGVPVNSSTTWPWMAWVEAKGFYAFCGGVLIGPRWVLTAGHCVSLVNWPHHKNIRVRLGMDNWQPSKLTKTCQEPKLAFVHMHPRHGYLYNFRYDMALIQLAEPVQLTDSVYPICLPESPPAPDTPGYVIGWGYNKYRQLSDVLKQGSVQTIAWKRCKQIFTSQFTENNVCTGAGPASCIFDSGGPLVSQGADGKWVVYGIVQGNGAGYKCGEAGTIYGDVASHRRWMAARMKYRDIVASSTSTTYCPLPAKLPLSPSPSPSPSPSSLVTQSITPSPSIAQTNIPSLLTILVLSLLLFIIII